jgi:hypothetical protein
MPKERKAANNYKHGDKKKVGGYMGQITVQYIRELYVLQTD